MEIIIKKKKNVEFGSLIIGQTFIDPEYNEDVILMVVAPALDVDIITDDDGASYYGYAVDLSTGMVVGYGSAEEIIPVDSTLTAERL